MMDDGDRLVDTGRGRFDRVNGRQVFSVEFFPGEVAADRDL